MLSTGDIQNHLRKLQTELRFIKLRDVDYKSLQTGNSCELLKIYHYIFLDYNPLFAKTLLDKYKSDFYVKTDNHFIETMYKTLRDYFNYKPSITKEQFFSTNFAEKKLQMAYDIITLIRQECKNLNTNQNQSKRTGSSSTRISTNIFHPLHDMGLETTVIDKFSSIEQPDIKKSSPLPDPHDQIKLRKTVKCLEEQIQILKIKIEDINDRINNITSILQNTHLDNSNLSKTSSDINSFNARLLIIENELSILKNQSITPQGILLEC